MNLNGRIKWEVGWQMEGSEERRKTEVGPQVYTTVLLLAPFLPNLLLESWWKGSEVIWYTFNLTS